MTPFLTTPPTVEPLSLAEAKAWLRLDTADEDATVSALIVAARSLVERSARRLLMRQEWRIPLDAWPADGVLPLPLAPVSAISAIRVLAADGTPSPVASTAYRLEGFRDPPLLVITGAVPTPGRPRDGIEIDVICGFSDDPAAVPEPLRHAVRLLVARWFEHRGDTLSDALALPPDIALLLSPYRRPRL